MTGMMKSRFTTSSTSSPVSVVDNSLEGGIIDLPIKEVYFFVKKVIFLIK